MSAQDRANQFPRGINLDGKVFVGTTEIDPSVVGFEAPIGSFLHNTVTGVLWRKRAALDTDWVKANADDLGFQFNAIFLWNANGNFQSGPEQDGMRAVVGEGSIVGITMYVADRGGAGFTEVDIKKHSATTIVNPGDVEFGVAGSTIYTTTANRPKIAGDNGNKTQNGLLYALQPDITEFAVGDFFTMDIAAITNASKDLTVAMLVRYN
jgi:hypothetical protein